MDLFPTHTIITAIKCNHDTRPCFPKHSSDKITQSAYSPFPEVEPPLDRNWSFPSSMEETTRMRKLMKRNFFYFFNPFILYLNFF